MNPFFFFQVTTQFWSATFEAMQFATDEMFVVRPPAKLVLIRGGKAN